jgi:hypothetical protein
MMKFTDWLVIRENEAAKLQKTALDMLKRGGDKNVGKKIVGMYDRSLKQAKDIKTAAALAGAKDAVKKSLGIEK